MMEDVNLCFKVLINSSVASLVSRFVFQIFHVLHAGDVRLCKFGVLSCCIQNSLDHSVARGCIAISLECYARMIVIVRKRTKKDKMEKE